MMHYFAAKAQFAAVIDTEDISVTELVLTGGDFLAPARHRESRHLHRLHDPLPSGTKPGIAVGVDQPNASAGRSGNLLCLRRDVLVLPPGCAAVATPEDIFTPACINGPKLVQRSHWSLRKFACRYFCPSAVFKAIAG